MIAKQRPLVTPWGTHDVFTFTGSARVSVSRVCIEIGGLRLCRDNALVVQEILRKFLDENRAEHRQSLGLDLEKLGRDS